MTRTTIGRLSVGFLSLVLVGLAAGVSAQQPLTVGLDATFAPHAMPKMGGGVEGFNVERFRNESLTIAVIRPKPGVPSPDGGPSPAVARDGHRGQATLVE